MTYASFVYDHQPLKSEPWRVMLVVRGDKLSYNEDAGSPASNMIETKILLNSIISDAKKGAVFSVVTLKIFLSNIYGISIHAGTIKVLPARYTTKI